jgi:hypothetical protein
MDRLKLMFADSAIVYQKIATLLSYLIGSGLLVGDLMNYLNQNAAGIGVLIGIATVLMNWFYQHKRSKND